MSDQFGEKLSTSDLDELPVILILADRRGSSHSELWGTELEAEFERMSIPVHFLAVADLTGSPYVLRPLIRGHIRRKHPTSVLLDWKGLFKNNFNTEDEVANLYVFDAQHELVYSAHETSVQAHKVVQIVDIVQGLTK